MKATHLSKKTTDTFSIFGIIKNKSVPRNKKYFLFDFKNKANVAG
jgi:hypothetical protein